MTELGLVQPVLADMQLFVYNRPLHPELFHIYMDKRIKRRRYEAQIWLTGTSHVVSFVAGKQWITELTANQSDLLPRKGLIHNTTIRRDREYRIVEDNGPRYIITAQVEHMSENVYRYMHQDLRNYAQQRGLFMAFDHWAMDELVPFTFIDYESRPNELSIYAYHGFPQQFTMLRSQSIFELA